MLPCAYYRDRTTEDSFHSISFPSEWGLRPAQRQRAANPPRVSIQLVSPASGDMEANDEHATKTERFHSISFPSEWGPLKQSISVSAWYRPVSIQLVSPASGDEAYSLMMDTPMVEFPFN